MTQDGRSLAKAIARSRQVLGEDQRTGVDPYRQAFAFMGLDCQITLATNKIDLEIAGPDQKKAASFLRYVSEHMPLRSHDEATEECIQMVVTAMVMFGK